MLIFEKADRSLGSITFRFGDGHNYENMDGVLQPLKFKPSQDSDLFARIAC